MQARAQVIDIRRIQSPGRCQVRVLLYGQSNRCRTERAGDIEQITRLRRSPLHHRTSRNFTEDGDGNRDRPRPSIRIPADQMHAERRLCVAQTSGEPLHPVTGRCLGKAQRHQISSRRRPFCGEIRNIHRQRFPTDILGRVARAEMHALGDRIGLDDEIVPGRRRDRRAIIPQPERARIANSQGRQETLDDRLLAADLRRGRHGPLISC